MTKLAQMTTTIQASMHGSPKLEKGDFIEVYPVDNMPDEPQYQACYWAHIVDTSWTFDDTRMIHRSNFAFVDHITYNVQFEDKNAGSMYGHETTHLTDFNDLQRAYGRCVSKVYYDTVQGKLMVIGWAFERTERYEDTNEPYTRTTWVTRPRHLHTEEK